MSSGPVNVGSVEVTFAVKGIEKALADIEKVQAAARSAGDVIGGGGFGSGTGPVQSPRGAHGPLGAGPSRGGGAGPMSGSPVSVPTSPGGIGAGVQPGWGFIGPGNAPPAPPSAAMQKFLGPPNAMGIYMNLMFGGWEVNTAYRAMEMQRVQMMNETSSIGHMQAQMAGMQRAWSGPMAGAMGNVLDLFGAGPASRMNDLQLSMNYEQARIGSAAAGAAANAAEGAIGLMPGTLKEKMYGIGQRAEMSRQALGVKYGDLDQRYAELEKSATKTRRVPTSKTELRVQTGPFGDEYERVPVYEDQTYTEYNSEQLLQKQTLDMHRSTRDAEKRRVDAEEKLEKERARLQERVDSSNAISSFRIRSMAASSGNAFDKRRNALLERMNTDGGAVARRFGVLGNEYFEYMQAVASELGEVERDRGDYNASAMSLFGRFRTGLVSSSLAASGGGRAAAINRVVAQNTAMGFFSMPGGVIANNAMQSGWAREDASYDRGLSLKKDMIADLMARAPQAAQLRSQADSLIEEFQAKDPAARTGKRKKDIDGIIDGMFNLAKRDYGESFRATAFDPRTHTTQNARSDQLLERMAGALDDIKGQLAAIPVHD